MAQKKLVRSSNRVFGGVLGGIGDYMDVDPTIVRVAYVALTIFTTGFPGLLLYILMLLLIPHADPKDNIPDAEVVE
ncbi:MAG: PspC domain-containing protein [Paludibacteraceae bacterium]|nr:PspC domain-containing protein [Paludibacteraceae bacterium]